eukprot:4511477-Lingulodinium_polyedra.AAC.1
MTIPGTDKLTPSPWLPHGSGARERWDAGRRARGLAHCPGGHRGGHRTGHQRCPHDPRGGR